MRDTLIFSMEIELDEDYSGTPKKKKSKVEEWFDKLTPEEQVEFRRKQSERMKKKWADLREKKEKAAQLAESLVPQVIANEIADNLGVGSRPDPRIIAKFREVVGAGEPLEKIRVKYFKNLNDDRWNNFKKFLFQDKVSQVEDLGNMLLAAQDKHKILLQKRIRELRKEINHWKRSRKEDKKYSAPISLMTMLYEAQNKLLELDVDIPKALSTVDAVGSKKGSPSVTIVTNIPAPGEKPEIKSVKTVEKLSLAEAMEKLGG